MQSLEGLHYLHNDCKIIHTDIKPENILIALNQQTITQMGMVRVLLLETLFAAATIGVVVVIPLVLHPSLT